ncbi:MAG TPA: hypothetical protein VHO71_04850 [Caproiciproducens sp.]|nr:hypothetical protein [Caproiciproducens sp.]
MSENKTPAAPAAEKKEFGTALTKVNDMFMPLITSQMEKNRIEMTPYSKECVLHSISAINAVLDKAGISWNDPQLDKSTISDILIKVSSFRLNAAASPREVYFQLRNEKSKATDPETGRQTDVWKKKVEMGIEGDGNDSILSRFGRGVQRVCQIWKVHENDDFKYPSYNGLDMTPPQWTPKGGGKIVKVVYPVIMTGHDGNSYTDFYIAERDDVINNLLAHINSNMMQETFGLAESKYKATAQEKSRIEARKRELLAKARNEGLDAALDDEELQSWISPAWTEFHSREAMIERKMRNNAIKKIPKDFGNGMLETMFEETTDDTYRATAQEIKQLANSNPIDIKVDEDTGEVMEPDQPTVDEVPEPDTIPVPDAPQEPPKEKPRQTAPHPKAKPTGGYNPGF